MHDNQLKELTGWPDVETAPSVVRCIKQSTTISNTGSLTNWDLHIIQWPWMTNQPFWVTQSRHASYANLGSVNGMSFGGLSAYVTAAGANLALGNTPNYQIVLDPSYQKGASRLLGIGVEAVNTTAEIYKQGQVFSWRQPEPQIQPSTWTIFGSQTGTGAANVVQSVQEYTCPPLNSESAMLLSGTRQWQASEGAYQVVPHVGQDNPPTVVSYIQPVVHVTETGEELALYAPGANAPVASLNTDQVLVPIPFVGVGTAGFYGQAFKLYPIHMTGLMFTGLSPQTTITLTQNVYLETFPAVSDKAIMVLATPSSEYDPIALQLYSNALMTLPVAVPADWNGFGDWFAEVVSSISSFLTPGALALGMPGVAAVSAGAGKLANAYMTAQSPQDKVESLKKAAAPVSLKLERKMIMDAVRAKPNPKKRKPKPRPAKPAGR